MDTLEASSVSSPNGTPNGVRVSAPTSTGFDPVALIKKVSADLVRSADPEKVFGSLVSAYAEHSATSCTVELLTGTSVRVLRSSCSAGGDDVVNEQPSLSPGARQLLAGDGAPLAGADWFVLPIGAVASQAADDEVPIGAFSCQFTNRRADSCHLEPAQYLISLATELLQAERRLAKALTQVANLEIALHSNRDIGTAIGILMNAHLVTQDQAFTMLRTASQHGHRKLRDIANDVIFTGSLSIPAKS
ncbi:ANTAR domain-containing protein [Jatrophihabitans sp.]|jgi:hypothetical protein|uniref:ANTAR domain-containing protein n=1 Tax=Jatrophihabitans sp. TaxID=1932789 RepID=UPI002EDD3E61